MQNKVWLLVERCVGGGRRGGMDSGVSSRQENSKVQGVQVVKLQYMTGLILKWRVMNEIRRGKHRSNLIDHTAL